MSLLGFDALGRLALGQIPESGNVVLPAVVGVFLESGEGAPFFLSVPMVAGSFTFAGLSDDAFKVGEAGAVGAFAFTGVAAAFKISEVGGAGSYLLTGAATADFIGEPVTPPGAFVLSGVATKFSIALAPAAGFSALAGYASTYSRDFEAWVKRPFEDNLWQLESPPTNSWTPSATPASTWTPE